jgi:hypothetical protein
MKPLVVVDTNVAVVANRRSRPQPTLSCVQACAHRLLQLQQVGRVALDNRWLILNEYKNNLNESGQPGIGDRFLKWVLTNRNNPGLCDQVALTPLENDETAFQEFPDDPTLLKFDRSDRKFVAVALAHPQHPPILQAVDSKWWQMREALSRNGVTVDFLCPNAFEQLQSAKQNRRRQRRRKK